MTVSLMTEAFTLAYVDECSVDTDSVACLAIALIETPIVLGPFLLALGYVFLLYERGAMTKRYDKSKYVLKPELHPKVNAQHQMGASPARMHLTMPERSQEQILNEQMT